MQLETTHNVYIFCLQESNISLNKKYSIYITVNFHGQKPLALLPGPGNNKNDFFVK